MSSLVRGRFATSCPALGRRHIYTNSDVVVLNWNCSDLRKRAVLESVGRTGAARENLRPGRRLKVAGEFDVRRIGSARSRALRTSPCPGYFSDHDTFLSLTRGIDPQVYRGAVRAFAVPIGSDLRYERASIAV